MEDRDRRRLREAADAIARAEALLITAGAGMGVDSGLPDFRGDDGFWRAYPPLRELGLSFEAMAQPHWFAQKPEMAWAWYGHRQQLYQRTAPHEGYQILRRWGQRMRSGSFVVTSNVDGHFRGAGFAADQILEVHGNLHTYQCSTPCSDVLLPGQQTFRVDVDRLTVAGTLPRCPTCGAVLRPNVLMFSDDRWVSTTRDAQQKRYVEWLGQTRGRRVVIVECGAGTAIDTIRRISERVAERSASTLIRINPDVKEYDPATVPLRMGALEALEEIERLVEEMRRA